jgi:hypothetical protein
MRKKIKSPDGKIYSYDASIRVVKVARPGSTFQYYRVETCIKWNPEVWVCLEVSDYLYTAIILAKSLAWVLCHSTQDRKQILEGNNEHKLSRRV